MRYKLRYYWYLFWQDFQVRFHAPLFITLLLALWLYHLLFHGWYNYFFHPRTYLITAGNIISDMDSDRKGTPWWDRYDCAAARQVVLCNDPEAIARFTWRIHPIFMDQEILYVSSPGYKAKVSCSKTKIYHQS